MSRLKFNESEQKAYLVFAALLRLFPDHVFFPRLKELSIVASANKDTYPVPFALLSIVESLVIETTPGEPSNTLDMLDALTTQAPPNSLKKLSLSGQMFPAPFHLWTFDPTEDRWQKLLRNLLNHHRGSLRHLVLTSAPAAPLVRMIEQLDVLEVLEVSERERDSLFGFGGRIRAPPIPSSFKRLRSITFHKVSGLERFREQGVQLPELESFTVKQRVLRDRELGYLPRILEYAGSFPSLRHVHVEAVRGYGARRGTMPSLRAPVFTGLLLCKKLEYLHVNWVEPVQLGLTNELVRAMSEAWPAMIHLYLSPALSINSQVTLPALEILARAFSKLEVLGFPVNENVEQFVSATQIDLLPPEVQKGRPTLRALNIGAPKFNDVNARHAAEFLMTLFPGANYIAVPPIPPQPAPPSPDEEYIPDHAMIMFEHPHHPPAPWEGPPPLPRNPEWEARIAVIETWRHVVTIAAEMRRRGARQIGRVLRDVVMSDPIVSLDAEKQLLEKDDDEAGYMDGAEE